MKFLGRRKFISGLELALLKNHIRFKAKKGTCKRRNKRSGGHRREGSWHSKRCRKRDDETRELNLWEKKPDYQKEDEEKVEGGGEKSKHLLKRKWV